MGILEVLGATLSSSGIRPHLIRPQASVPIAGVVIHRKFCTSRTCAVNFKSKAVLREVLLRNLAEEFRVLFINLLHHRLLGKLGSGSSRVTLQYNLYIIWGSHAMKLSLP